MCLCVGGQEDMKKQHLHNTHNKISHQNDCYLTLHVISSVMSLLYTLKKFVILT